MGDKKKTLCEWKKKDYTAKKILGVVSEAEYFCTNCGRVANKKKSLCKPEHLETRIGE